MTAETEIASGRLGIHSLDHFSIIVPDLSEARHFYESFGLDVRGERGGLSLYTFASSHLWGRIVEGPRKRLNYLSFSAYRQDMPDLARRLEALGTVRIDPPEKAFDQDGIWFRDLNGVALQIRPGIKKTVDEKEEKTGLPSFAGTRNAPLRGVQPPVRPARLSHVLIFVPDVFAAIRFYEESIGLRLSDRSEDAVAFLHAVHGCDHHLVAFAKSDRTGFHHSSWDVSSVDDVGRGAMQMREAGYDRGWGLGRHVLGSNYFHYVRDPWGSYAEYSHDMDYIPSGVAWQPTSPPPENSFYLWGPDVPEDFVVNYESQ